MLKSDATTLTGLVAYLYRDGLLDKAIVLNVQQAAIEAKMSLTQYLVATNLLSSDSLLTYCAKTFKLSIFDLTKQIITENIFIEKHIDIVTRYRILPLYRDDKYLYAGMSDPTDHAAISAIQFYSQLRIRILLVSEEALANHLSLYTEPQALHEQIEYALAQLAPESKSIAISIEEQPDEPVIVFVDQLLQEAIKNKISDIHIEPYAASCRIRFRRDGLLYEAATIPTYLALRITTRFKVMANLNIAERRLPQDGHLTIFLPQRIDIRLSTYPLLFGEKIVLRIFHNQQSPIEIAHLGMSTSQRENFLKSLHKPQGLILVTGPTGSGKTITLYSALHFLNQGTKNICTIEDPVEMELAGINQTNINQRIGLDFATALKHFLRQDPDVIMVGEIRDQETAKVAVHAAQTGHLVLATLHTNSAVETMARLKTLNVFSEELANALSLIIAQRLVRKLCNVCKKSSINNSDILIAVGCELCHQGYQGRTGIFEVVPITSIIAEHIANNGNFLAITQHIKENNISFLRESAFEKLKLGITTLHEITRVLGPTENNDVN